MKGRLAGWRFWVVLHDQIDERVTPSLDDAITIAKNLVQKDGQTRYIMKSVRRVESEEKPINVTILEVI